MTKHLFGGKGVIEYFVTGVHNFTNNVDRHSCCVVSMTQIFRVGTFPGSWFPDTPQPTLTLYVSPDEEGSYLEAMRQRTPIILRMEVESP